MNKRLKNKRPLKAHVFDIGGLPTIDSSGLTTGAVQQNPSGLKTNTTNTNLNTGNSGGGNFMANASAISGIAGMFDSLAQGISGGIDSGRSGTQGQPQTIVEGVLGSQTGSHLGKMWTINAKTNEALNYINQQGNVAYDTTNTGSLLSQYDSLGFMNNSNINTKGKELQDFIFDPASYLLTTIFGKRKTARQRQNEINAAIDAANRRRVESFNSAVANYNQAQYDNLLANYHAFGGPLFGGYDVESAASYDIAKDNAFAKQMQVQSKNSNSFNPTYIFADGGGIHIAPSKKGTFTAAAKKHGKSVQAFASQVLANPDNYSPAMRKKANFARNAAKWHADGGLLMSDEFTNGVTLIDQGGTHENNPNQGVQFGIAEDGLPNLVEEGEAIFNDYVFSNRLVVPKKVRNKYKLRGPKDMTFAEGFREAQKESEERPNDPISKNGLENIAMILARTQEAVRNSKNSHKKSKGGHLLAFGYPDYDPSSMTEEEYARIMSDYVDSTQPDVVITPTTTSTVPITPVVTSAPAPGVNTTTNEKVRNGNTRLNNLRHADAAVGALAVGLDAFGLTNKYRPLNVIPSYQAVGASPLGNYVPITHSDTRYAANRALQEAAASRDVIMQSTSPSRNAALLAADFNAQVAQGELLRQGALEDYERALRAEEFNRATNQFNTELGVKLGAENASNLLNYAQAKMQQEKANEDMSNAMMGARAQNLGNFAESLANIGREQDALNWRDMLIRAGVFGTLSEKPTDWTDREWAAYKKALTSSATSAQGGKIKRKKKGLTY